MRENNYYGSCGMILNEGECVLFIWLENIAKWEKSVSEGWAPQHAIFHHRGMQWFHTYCKLDSNHSREAYIKLPTTHIKLRVFHLYFVSPLTSLVGTYVRLTYVFVFYSSFVVISAFMYSSLSWIIFISEITKK